MNIVLLQERHLSALAAIEKACFSAPWSEDGLREELSNPTALFLVAQEQGEAVGYIGCHIVLDEGYITNVAVAPAYRRQGIGGRLVAALVACAVERQLVFVTLEARASNIAARSLYARAGFCDVGTRKDYYIAPCENAQMMTLRIETDTIPHLKMVDIHNTDLLSLIAQLDDYFYKAFGEIAQDHHIYNSLQQVQCAVVAYVGAIPVGCGCWRPYNATTGEIKRMFICPAYRQHGIGRDIVIALEQNAMQAGLHTIILETGANMPQAIAFYGKLGYVSVDNFDDFIDDPHCVCMKKQLGAQA